MFCEEGKRLLRLTAKDDFLIQDWNELGEHILSCSQCHGEMRRIASETRDIRWL